MRETRDSITRVMDATKKLLLHKNEKYGDSALSPLGIFTDGDPRVNLGARMEDKLMRLKEVGMTSDSVDTLYDVQGYIALMIIAIERTESVDSADMLVEGDTNTSKIIQDEDTENNNVRVGLQDRQTISHNPFGSAVTHTGRVFFEDGGLGS